MDNLLVNASDLSAVVVTEQVIRPARKPRSKAGELGPLRSSGRLKELVEKTDVAKKT
ncbi:hypothetical protein M422DRAFT_35681 [Sphaerobolus stellatus SS14]|uniref:Uncharacterized protein n=1 Tax=Sphaerobolus stellatus (strain SS14) TaxID=990650 RepID=A0A0C9UUE9_SPHS4|nr:hypothetical protein M422DRAFT_35681 [Sphaerobolus stellatus SS14]